MLRQVGRTRAEALAVYVEELIQQRRLQPGDHIATRADLREQTAAARATVNEAVRILENRGRVTPRPGPGGGLFVASASPFVQLGQTLLTVRRDAQLSVTDAIVIRNALEPLIADSAARNRSPKDVRELRALARKLETGTQSTSRFMDANWRLHERIARITPNELLQAIYLGLWSFIEDQAAPRPAWKGEAPPHIGPMVRLHAALVEAIVEGDWRQARKLADQHALQLLGLTERSAGKDTPRVPKRSRQPQ